MCFNLNEHQRDIQAFYPIYQDGLGNVTQVDTVDGESYTIETTLRTFLNNLSTCFAVDRTALQHKYGQLTGQKNMVALPLGLRYVFIPLQLREPLVPGDGSTGYVQLHRIKNVMDYQEDGFKSIICFTDNRTLKCLNTCETVRRHLAAARFIYETYLQEFCGNMQYREMLGLVGILQRMTERKE